GPGLVKFMVGPENLRYPLFCCLSPFPLSENLRCSLFPCPLHRFLFWTILLSLFPFVFNWADVGRNRSEIRRSPGSTKIEVNVHCNVAPRACILSSQFGARSTVVVHEYQGHTVVWISLKSVDLLVGSNA